jgi:fumarylacetoacetate (FAA) hydrolase
MKLASLKGPPRDGTLVVVDRKLARAVKADGIAPTMQHDALENWDSGRAAACAMSPKGSRAAAERHAFDFPQALREGKVAAPLPRAYEWLDGSAYLSHVERVRRARNDKVPRELLHRSAHVPRAARAT